MKCWQLFTDLTSLISDHTCFAAFHSIKIRECHKKKRGGGGWGWPVQHLCFQKTITNGLVGRHKYHYAPNRWLLSSVVALWGYIYIGNCKGAEDTKLFAAAGLPDMQASSFLQLTGDILKLHYSIFYAMSFWLSKTVTVFHLLHKLTSLHPCSRMELGSCCN